MNTNNKLECRIKRMDRNELFGSDYYVYFGSERFSVSIKTTSYQRVWKFVDETWEKSDRDMDKFNSLMIEKLDKITNIYEIINTIVVLRVKGLHGCMKEYTSRLLLEQIRNGDLKHS